jgi:hypothetical protein
VTFTAAVAPGWSTLQGGTVTFSDGGTPLATVALAGAMARFSTVLAPGAHSLTAAYSGTADFRGSTSEPVPVSVAQPVTGDVTSQVGILLPKARRNRKTRRYEQRVTITNTGGQVLQGPLTLVLKRLRSTAKLVGPSGMMRESRKRRSPFIRVSVGGDTLLAPGAAVRVTLRFSAQPNRYTPVVLAGPGMP